jgi:hypothetical protein
MSLLRFLGIIVIALIVSSLILWGTAAIVLGAVFLWLRFLEHGMIVGIVSTITGCCVAVFWGWFAMKDPR